MPEIVTIPLADLLVYSGNARLQDDPPTQQATLLALAKQQGNRLLKLAADIVEYGTDPTALLIVVATADQRKRYLVLEGNRRVTTLKGLDTPSLILPAFSSAGQKRFSDLAKRYSAAPIKDLNCVLFESMQEASHWIDLRHTGQNEGAGLVEWGAEEKDRYVARHKKRSTAGQVLDFVDKFGTLSPAASGSNRDIITTLTRLLSTPQVRDALGIGVQEGEVVQIRPTEYVAKTLTKVVEDLKTGNLKVAKIYTAEDRVRYAANLIKEFKPKDAHLLTAPTPLGEAQLPSLGMARKKRPRQRKVQSERTALIPSTCVLDISPPRINLIYIELLGMSVDQYANACSVLLRVFLELSVDHYLTQLNLMSEAQRRSQNLAKRIKACSADLLGRGKINTQLEMAIQKIADSPFLLAASTVTFNQYVHNQYVFPKPTELRVAWDEIQPFMEALWP